MQHPKSSSRHRRKHANHPVNKDRNHVNKAMTEPMNQATKQADKAMTEPMSTVTRHVHKATTKAAAQAVKQVTLHRGWCGYGFTISSQRPCVLSCIIPHSPAHLAGLTAGDTLQVVNGVHVAEAPHDDVVQLIGQSTGGLQLQVTQNVSNRVESSRKRGSLTVGSDRCDEAPPLRSRANCVGKDKMTSHSLTRRPVGKSVSYECLKEERSYSLPSKSSVRLPRQSGNDSSHLTSHVSFGREVTGQEWPDCQPASPGGREWPDCQPASPGCREWPDCQPASHGGREWPDCQPASHGGRAWPDCQPASHGGREWPDVSSKVEGSSFTHTSCQKRNVTVASSLHTPKVSSGKLSPGDSVTLPRRSRCAALHTPKVSSGKLSPGDSVTLPRRSRCADAVGCTNRCEYGDSDGQTEPAGGGPSGHAATVPPIIQRQTSPLPDTWQAGADTTAVVGYIGSVQLPHASHGSSRRLQLKSCVKRLRKKQTFHAVVLMEVGGGGVRLSTGGGGTVAFFPADHMIFSAVCPDLGHFFGIITSSPGPALDPAERGSASLRPSSVSCHVFKVDPFMACHTCHVHRAKAFQVHCLPHPVTQHCQQFPPVPDHLVQRVASLYQSRPHRHAPSQTVLESSSQPLFKDHPHRHSQPQAVVESSRQPMYEGSPHRHPQFQAVVESSRQPLYDHHPHRYPQTQAVVQTSSRPLYQDHPHGHPQALAVVEPTRKPLYEDDPPTDAPFDTLMKTSGHPMHHDSSSSDSGLSMECENVCVNRQYLPDVNKQPLVKEKTCIDTFRGLPKRLRISTKTVPNKKFKRLSEDSVIPECTTPRSVSLQTPSSSCHPECLSHSSTSSLRFPCSSSSQEYLVREPSSEQYTVQASVNKAFLPDTSVFSDFLSCKSTHPTHSSAHPQHPTHSSAHPQHLTHSSAPQQCPSTTSNNAACLSRPSTTAHGFPEVMVQIESSSVQSSPQVWADGDKLLKGLPEHASGASLRMEADRVARSPGSSVSLDEEEHTSAPEDMEHSGHQGLPLSLHETDNSGQQGLPLSLHETGNQWPQTIETRPEKQSDRLELSLEGLAQEVSRSAHSVGQSQGLGTVSSGDHCDLTSAGQGSHELPPLAADDLDREQPTRSGQSDLLTVYPAVAAPGNQTATPCGTQEEEKEGVQSHEAGWGSSFQRLLDDVTGFRLFTEFLTSQHSDENIRFWSTVEDFKRLTDPHTRRGRALDIYDRYLSAGATDPINVDCTARAVTSQGLANPSPGIFEIAQQQVYDLMRTDCYHRFLNSDLYKGHLRREGGGDRMPDIHPERSTRLPQTISQSEDTENRQKRRRSCLSWKSSSKLESKKAPKTAQEHNKKGDNNNNIKSTADCKADTPADSPCIDRTSHPQGAGWGGERGL